MRGNILTVALADLPAQGLVSAQQQLLAGLPPRVKGARDLRAAEGAVGQQPAVFAGEGHALGHALINDVDADLRQPIDIGFARPEIAALDRVVEQPLHAVAVVLIILGRVDSALRRDAVGAARAVLVTKGLHVVAQLRQARRRRRARPDPVPTTMTSYFRLLAGLTSFMANLC